MNKKVCNKKDKCCNIYGSNQPMENFSKDKTRKDGLQSWCKSCNKLYRKNNIDNIKIYGKEYRKNNKDYFLNYFKNHYQLNRKSKAFIKQNTILKIGIPY